MNLLLFFRTLFLFLLHFERNLGIFTGVLFYTFDLAYLCSPFFCFQRCLDVQMKYSSFSQFFYSFKCVVVIEYPKFAFTWVFALYDVLFPERPHAGEIGKLNCLHCMLPCFVCIRFMDSALYCHASKSSITSMVCAGHPFSPDADDWRVTNVRSGDFVADSEKLRSGELQRSLKR